LTAFMKSLVDTHTQHPPSSVCPVNGHGAPAQRSSPPDAKPVDLAEAEAFLEQFYAEMEVFPPHHERLRHRCYRYWRGRCDRHRGGKPPGRHHRPRRPGTLRSARPAQQAWQGRQSLRRILASMKGSIQDSKRVKTRQKRTLNRWVGWRWERQR